jgi:1-aminocyclopropane-1-carboxylate deaminase/D-cysteine desulfhydrase-like pyridoxal-dependent ACC family enzyme
VLIALARDGTIPRGARVLYVHTGGLPALFAYEPELTAGSTAASEAVG